MDEQRIAEIRERVDAATPGPWEQSSERSQCEVYSTPTALVVAGTLKAADADLIANAPADLADLLDERDRLLSDNLLLRTVADAAEIVAQGFDDDGPTVADIAYLDDALAAAVRAYRTTTGEPEP